MNKAATYTAPPTDTDKDGIPDNLDKCPKEAETFNGYQDTDGCPDTVPSESSSGTPQCQEGYYYDSSKQACVPNSDASSSGTPQCQEGYYYDYSKQVCAPKSSTG